MTKNIYALLVGIDFYDPHSLIPIPTLQGCVNDITAIESYLKEQVAGEWTLHDPKILTNEQATRNAIINGFQNYLTQAKKDDIALFYYSGHGGQEKAPEEFWDLEPDRLDETLVCYDSRTEGNHDLADKEIRFLLAQVAEKNPRIIVILDSCHSGSGTRDIPGGVRLAPEDSRERDLSTFIFAEDLDFKNSLLNSLAVEKKKTGLDLPKGRHILLAACRDYQYAKEYKTDEGEARGVFSYFLLKSLEQSNGNLSYLDLARNIEALVSGKAKEQVPQIEATNPEDLKESFLGDAIPERPIYFNLTYNQVSSDKGWEIDSGAIQGIPKPSSYNDKNTRLAIFPAGTKGDDLQQLSKAIGKAEVTKVLTAKSKVEITETTEDLDENQNYWAVVTSLPLEPLKVYFQASSGEENGLTLIKNALQKANGDQPSLSVKQVEDGCDLRLMSVATTDELVDEGQSLVIVALVGTALHIRIFDVNGEQVVDKVESELIVGEALTKLRQRLDPFPDESNLSPVDKQKIIKYATSSAGHTLEDTTEADYHLLIKNGQYWIIQDDRPVVAPIPEPPGYSEIAAKETIQALEAIARWTNILNLQSSTNSSKSINVEMEIIKYGYEDEEGNISLCEDENLDNINSDSSEYYLEYKYEDQQWKRPIVKVKLTNHSEKQLFCSVLLLSTDYTIASRNVLFQPDGEGWEAYPEDTITLFGKSSEKSNTFESFVFLQIEEDFLDKGITEIKDVFKLIVSKTDFNADLLEQEGLEPPPTKRSKSIPEGTLESLMLQVQTRSHGAPRRKVDDWITKQVAVTIVKPRDAEELKANKNVELLNGLVQVQSHPSLEAKVTLTTVAQTTRDIGNLVIPSILKDEQGVIDSFQFTSSRGDDPGLSAIELFNVNDFNSVTKEQPLKILVNQTLEEDAKLLPVSYDGEFFLPLGRGTQEGKGIEITLERLPEPTTSSRSLGGSIKIFFKKLRHQKLGHSYDYPILATAEVIEENKKIKVSYQPELSKPNLEEVKQRVDSAKKIVLYIHGIIGDTESMVGSVKQAKVKVDGQLKPLRELYDLVLTFDYENLHTTIEENARGLKQRLEYVGLGANHGKELHIVAHSMGGLVSRWFIEREGGNKVVQHLVMLGTPNAGSPWPAVQDMTFSMLTFGLNQIPDLAWPAKVLADLTVKSLKFVEEHDNALDQMQPDSPFFPNLSANFHDPQVLYTIIAGDRSIPRTEKQLNRLQRLMAKLSNPIINKVVDDLVFGKEPNDIAVLLDSIKSVSGDRSPSPKILPDVACDHLTYFTTEAGLTALADALSF